MNFDYEESSVRKFRLRTKRLAAVLRIGRRVALPALMVLLLVVSSVAALLVRHWIVFPTRTTTLTFVDIASGRMVAADVDLLAPNVELQFESNPMDAALSASSPCPGRIVVTRNIDVTVPVSCGGYQTAYVHLTSSSPRNLLVRLSASQATTRP